MTDILIRTKKENIAHKMESQGIIHAWWTIPGVPKKEIDSVMFTDGKRVIAEGKAIGFDQKKKAIVFRPLKKVNEPLPKKAPARGFTYVD
jgi:uncharacterized protein (UPF0335 family)